MAQLNNCNLNKNLCPFFGVIRLKFKRPSNLVLKRNCLVFILRSTILRFCGTFKCVVKRS